MPIRLAPDVPAELAAGDAHACVRTVAGTVRCWGYGGVGQLGNGNGTDVGDEGDEYPTQVDLGGARVVALAAGGGSTCAVTDAGAVRCWGYNLNGQLGAGNTENLMEEPGDAASTVPLPLARVAVDVTVGAYHACALLDTHQVTCWGFNTHGQLGIGSTDTMGDASGELPLPGYVNVMGATGSLCDTAPAAQCLSGSCQSNVCQ